jgi:Rad3-related DNA helicase
MFRSAEQTNFYQKLKVHLSNPDAPLLLEGTTGLGKTRAYLAAVADAVSAGKKIALIFPTHMLIEQLISSSDRKAVLPKSVSVHAFLPRSRFESQGDYALQRQQARSADVLVATSASVIIDQRLKGEYNGAITRDVLIFDEADQLPEAAALQSDCEITGNELSELGIKAISAKQAVTEVLSKRDASLEIRAIAMLILEEIDEPAWYKSVGLTEDGGVMLYHRLPGRLLKRISNQKNVAFISATLSIGGTFDDFRRSMGIVEQSHLSGIIEPKNHGTVRFHVADLEVNSQEWLAGTIKAIEDAPKPCLVVTPSHDLAETLIGFIHKSVLRTREETTSKAASRMGEAETLIAAGAWAGLDTPIQWASVIVPRIPYDRPIVLDDQIESSFLHTRSTAIRRMRQVIGRGLRTPDSHCEIFILDRRYKNIESFIPLRFQQDWSNKAFTEGKRVEVTLSKAERDPSVRRKALSHYGKRCVVCNFQPKVDSQLEVHHLFPVASGGERVTSITDVAVLCANCHRLAHSSGFTPLSIDTMKKML